MKSYPVRDYSTNHFEFWSEFWHHHPWFLCHLSGKASTGRCIVQASGIGCSLQLAGTKLKNVDTLAPTMTKSQSWCQSLGASRRCQSMSRRAASLSKADPFEPQSGNHVDVSKNRGTPKWMVYNGKPLLKWMIWGYPYFWKHPCHVKGFACFCFSIAPNDFRNALCPAVSNWGRVAQWIFFSRHKKPTIGWDHGKVAGIWDVNQPGLVYGFCFRWSQWHDGYHWNDFGCKLTTKGWMELNGFFFACFRDCRCVWKTKLGGGFKDFLLSPLFGEDSHFD